MLKKHESTWIDFKNENEDVEKLEFPIPNQDDKTGVTIHNYIMTDARQSDIFIGELKNWNLLD